MLKCRKELLSKSLEKKGVDYDEVLQRISDNAIACGASIAPDSREDIRKYRIYMNTTVICVILTFVNIVVTSLLIITRDPGEQFITTQDGRVIKVTPLKTESLDLL